MQAQTHFCGPEEREVLIERKQRACDRAAHGEAEDYSLRRRDDPCGNGMMVSDRSQRSLPPDPKVGVVAAGPGLAVLYLI